MPRGSWFCVPTVKYRPSFWRSTVVNRRSKSPMIRSGSRPLTVSIAGEGLSSCAVISDVSRTCASRALATAVAQPGCCSSAWMAPGRATSWVFWWTFGSRGISSRASSVAFASLAAARASLACSRARSFVSKGKASLSHGARSIPSRMSFMRPAVSVAGALAVKSPTRSSPPEA